jgi:hypothetical protein
MCMLVNVTRQYKVHSPIDCEQLLLFAVATPWTKCFPMKNLINLKKELRCSERQNECKCSDIVHIFITVVQFDQTCVFIYLIRAYTLCYAVKKFCGNPYCKM